MKDSATIAKDCFNAYVRKDRAAVENLIAEDFHFTSPLDNRIDRKTYFERCWPNSEHIQKFEFIHTFSHGNKASITYQATDLSGNAFRNTEVFTIAQDKIIEVEVYFGWSIPHKAPEHGFVSE